MRKAVLTALLILFSAPSVFGQTLVSLPELPRGFTSWDHNNSSRALSNGDTSPIYMRPSTASNPTSPKMDQVVRIDYILIYGVGGKAFEIWIDTGLEIAGGSVSKTAYFLRPDGQWLKLSNLEFGQDNLYKALWASNLTHHFNLGTERYKVNGLCMSMHQEIINFYDAEFQKYAR
ncbi:MAG: hypothetical protein A3H69_05680 [Candidatus Sungbacteria bacterium RIFCSPLOWO2_02_FULL_47_9]|nr:MAG: hypothetical protein UX72_C0004G0057 [Parcubacteria group bacterium GW2011_GWA2_47_10]OGZ99085.1 MAG: hypothetical protein A3D57_03480 [Candidatus Sungbacteria bacterium RIFCSPHIGHO2_02_FULL_46_12]OHA04577.1 MAG: hypothetical protein A3A28_01300 [Candidatus Sungbacteria bacterium RIFCSPLOWO2_01_FULL_47_32]OHA10122.1 MAG: hypothetical protein A3H69_05680 [Candidatus Sungbacteria bacterium RIFCSPLOWO2_02_FULL_47_9]